MLATHSICGSLSEKNLHVAANRLPCMYVEAAYSYMYLLNSLWLKCLNGGKG